jgi:hypothetical protein
MIDPAALVSMIEGAFDGVTLEDGVSLNECEFADSGGTATVFRDAAANDERENWRLIADDLTRFEVTFCFTDLRGYRFYLPAYMIWTIRNFRTSNSIIADFTIYACDPDRHQFKEMPFVQFFDHAQLQAIVSFLQFCAEHEEPDARAVRGNLQKISQRLGSSSRD